HTLTATPSPPTPPLHDALPISGGQITSLPAPGMEPFNTGHRPDNLHKERDMPQIPGVEFVDNTNQRTPCVLLLDISGSMTGEPRSEEHTSELQSRENLVCRLLL